MWLSKTGVPPRTISHHTHRFVTAGMASLLPDLPAPPRRMLPDEIRFAILDLKAEHPAFRPNELATICYDRFGQRPSVHTVEKVLAEDPFCDV